MAPPTKADNKLQVQEQRRARLEAELRANLHKRKQQARSRAQRDAASDPTGTDAAAADEPASQGAPAGRTGRVA
jgi:hypothetical protein